MPEDTRVEDTQDISEETETEGADAGGEDTSRDNAGEDSSGSLEEYIDGIDPESVKDGTFDEEEWNRRTGLLDADTGEGEGESHDEGEGGTKPDPESTSGLKIVHNGQEIVVPEEKVRQLVQKGFDYDTKVGPHARLAEVLEANPEIAMEVNKLVLQRLGLGPSPDTGGSGNNPDIPAPDGMGDDDVDPYTAEQFERLFAKKMAPFMATMRSTQAEQLHGQLVGRDGQELFNAAHMEVIRVASRSDPEVIAKIDSDPATYQRYYERAKKEIVDSGFKPPAKPAPKPAPNKPAAPARGQKSGFRVATGGRREPDAASRQKNFWEYSKKEFEDYVASIKGTPY